MAKRLLQNLKLLFTKNIAFIRCVQHYYTVYTLGWLILNTTYLIGREVQLFT